MVDDVASLHSDEDYIGVQVSQIDIPGAGKHLPATMTPPHTPPSNLGTDRPKAGANHRRLLTKLGGYGWRG
jgi:hypothetical protein